eukprot:scpid109316/ scgid7700/ 
MLRGIFPNQCPRFIYYAPICGAIAILLLNVLAFIQCNTCFVHNALARYLITGNVAQFGQGDHRGQPFAEARKNVDTAGQGHSDGSGQGASPSSSRALRTQKTSGRP